MHHWYRRRALTGVVLGVVLALLGGRDAQAQQPLAASWFGTLVHTLASWAPPSWWAWAERSGGPESARLHPALVGANRARPQAARGAIPNACYGGMTDPDGNCVH